MGFYSGDSGVGDYQRKGMGFITHHEVKWGLISDGVRVVIVSEFSMGDIVSPRGVVPTKDLKVGIYFLVYLCLRLKKFTHIATMVM